MFYHSAPDVWAPALAGTIGMLVFLSAPILIVYFVLRHRRQVTEMRLKAMLDLAARGAPVPHEWLMEKPGRPGVADLRAGLVLLTTGVGIMLFALTLKQHPAWGIGLLPLFAGIGFLVTWKVGRAGSTSGNG
jgi:hypothetical protein